MEDVLPVVAAEVWGDVGEEKEAGAFAGGCKEAKHVRAFATYQLLAAGTTFRTHFGPLLGLVRARCCSWRACRHASCRSSSMALGSLHPRSTVSHCNRRDGAVVMHLRCIRA